MKVKAATKAFGRQFLICYIELVRPPSTMVFDSWPHLNRKSAKFDFMVLATVSRYYSKD